MVKPLKNRLISRQLLGLKENKLNRREAKLAEFTRRFGPLPKAVSLTFRHAAVCSPDQPHLSESGLCPHQPTIYSRWLARTPGQGIVRAKGTHLLCETPLSPFSAVKKKHAPKARAHIRKPATRKTLHRNHLTINAELTIEICKCIRAAYIFTL